VTTWDHHHPDHRTGRLAAYLAAYTERWGHPPTGTPEYVPSLEDPVTLETVLAVAIPAREVVNLNDARRDHWAVKSRKANVLRARGRLAVRLAGSPRMVAARCVVQVFYPDRRKRDVANLYPTVKALVDGMVEAGLLPDDDDTHLTGPHLEHPPEGVPAPVAVAGVPVSARPFLFVLRFTAPAA
jgi:hypothetical protein